MRYGCHSKVGKIRKILIKHPKDAFLSQEVVDSQWKDLNYYGCPDYDKSLEEYEHFVNLLKETIPEIYYLSKNDNTHLDSIYTHDPILVTESGAVLCHMGKEERNGEPLAAGEYLSELGIPMLGAITGKGRLEGGDTVWLDERTLAVGQGYRTNREGIRQLGELTEDCIDALVVVPLPHWRGPDDVLHLMSLISPVDRNLAVVYSRLMPVPFRELLLNRGIKLIEVSEDEYETMGCNILTVAPRRCIMIAGNPRTKQMLEEEGVEVREYIGEEISKKGAGGPTCLTRPILREV